MRSWWNFNRSILFFCTLMVVLLLWLSVSFLMQAYNERQDALFLDRYLDTDSVIRNTVSAVAEERVASHWLTGMEGLFSAENSLIGPHSRTDESIRLLLDEIDLSLAAGGFASQLTYQPAHIQKLVETIRTSVENLRLHRVALVDDLDLPLEQRNPRLQLSVFDYYGHLISQLEELRYAFRYRPTRLSAEVATSLKISNAAWNLNLSHHVLSALFDSYITTGTTAMGSAYERSLDMQRSVDRHWDQIKNVDAYSGVDHQLHAQAIQLNDWFGEYYFPQVKRMTRAIGETSPPPYTNWEWRKLAQTLEQRTEEIFERANHVSAQKIDHALERASRNLMIDVVLVLLCAGLMTVALSIGRRIHFQANHDDLTQLVNRRMFKQQSEIVLDEAAAKHHSYVLAVVNLDHFKSVNDSLGQLTGDRLLQRIAQRISKAAGHGAVVGRMGGDEFSVLMRYHEPVVDKTVADKTEADKTAVGKTAGDKSEGDKSGRSETRGDESSGAHPTVAKIAEAVSDRFAIGAQSVHITARIGYSTYPHDATSLEELRKAADLAIHDARRKGAGTIEAYNPTIAKAFQERQSLKEDLSRAIERNEFELHYQPQVDLESGVVDGVEALLRWNHPRRGNVPPFHFIEIAEDAGYMPQIGRWVIEQAATQAALWRDTAGLEFRVSVNVSVHQFLHGQDIAKFVRHTLDAHNIEAAGFEIEITESVAMAEMDRVLEQLQSLRQLGVRVALDDFGTGYSSLGYLQDLPLDTLKIDRSFITKLDDGSDSERVLLESIAHIARGLNFHTVAEGVETDIQLYHVRALGVDTVQGYYFSKPLPASAVPDAVVEINTMHGASQRAA